jgi:hypothetical protein
MQRNILAAAVLALSTTFALAAEPDSMAKDSGTMSMQAMPRAGSTSSDSMMSDDKMGGGTSMQADDKAMHDDKMMHDDAMKKDDDKSGK